MARKPRKPMTDEQKRLVEENIGLVGFVVNQYRNMIEESDADDIYQCGCLGLMNSAMTYDPNVGTFSTYAVRGIQIFIRNFFRHRNVFDERINREAIRLDKGIGKFENIDAITVMDQIAVYDESEMYARLYAQDILRIIQTMRPLHQRISDLLIRGESQSEIARSLGCSKQNVNIITKHIREVIYREYINCTNEAES